MGAFDWFWKAMGAQSERNDNRSKRVVAGADERTAQLTELDDAALARIDALTDRRNVTNVAAEEPETTVEEKPVPAADEPDFVIVEE